jgi:3-hydroxybutyrate dehydrogenase
MNQDRVALVTGAGSGIGQAIAHALRRGGARVIVHDLQASGETVAAAIGADFVQADLSDPVQVRRLADDALAVAGRIDILVNNAGFQHIAPVDEFPEERWMQMLQVMLTAPFQLIKYLLPSMKTRGWGRIINIASIHGQVASPYKSAYISAKHGLLGLTKTVALEIGTHGVTANAICPGYVRTPLVERQIADQARTRGLAEADVIKRLIEPDEIAELACFLASPGAGAITGAAFNIDLGWTAR